MGPVTTGLGEVVMYTVGYKNPDGKGAKKVAGQPGWQPDVSYLTPEGDILTDEIAKAGYLRTVQDWIVSPNLKSVGGVAGVDSIGGYAKRPEEHTSDIRSLMRISYAVLRLQK